MLENENIQSQRIRQSLYTLLGKELINSILEKRTEELMLNPDGRMFVKCSHGILEQVGCIDPYKASTIIRTIASLNSMEINLNCPVIDSEIDFLKVRFSAVLPPLVKAPVFCIRSFNALSISFEELKNEDFISEQLYTALKKLILQKKNILICGQTACGKTTFLNSLINLVLINDSQTRIVSIEDTPELKLSGCNCVNLYTTRDVDMSYLVKTSLRLSPDRIVVGEIRSKEALDMLDALSTGHDGAMCSMHAGNALQALERLKLLVSRNHNAPLCIERLICSAVNAIVVLKKDPYRHVHSIALVHGFDNKNYELEILGENKI